MSALKGLTFAPIPRNTGMTPEQYRRAKLADHLREQLANATAQAEGRIHVVKRRRWEYTDDGQKHLIEVDKRLRQWWTKQQDGKVLFSVRYGSKPLEFEKGKGAIVLKSVDELLAVLPKLIAAAEAGEFDAMIIAAGKPKAGFVTRRPS
jgi:hypothetical protein